jgi:hypothetical protein
VPSAAGARYLAINNRAAGIDQVRVGCDLAEAPGPVIAAAGEYLDRVVKDVELDTLTVELDLMDPAIA